MERKVSIVIPAKNEAQNLTLLLPKIRKLYPEFEVLVVDDGSTDESVEICRENGARVVSHKMSMGNGAAIKTGARNATGDILVFMDGDGQHPPELISTLLEELESGHDMAVAARSKKSQASLLRLFANEFYNILASKIVGHKVLDLTSGFRAVDAKLFRMFLFMLPNTFSYPTTISMAFFRSGFSVKYVPFDALSRLGKSHIHLLKDGFRFFIIIFKVGTLFSPLKVFLPISMVYGALGLLYYFYTYATVGRFTNMGVVLMMVSMLIALIGLVSEQITTLIYQKVEER